MERDRLAYLYTHRLFNFEAHIIKSNLLSNREGRLDLCWSVTSLNLRENTINFGSCSMDSRIRSSILARISVAPIFLKRLHQFHPSRHLPLWLQKPQSIPGILHGIFLYCCHWKAILTIAFIACHSKNKATTGNFYFCYFQSKYFLYLCVLTSLYNYFLLDALCLWLYSRNNLKIECYT